MYITIYVNTKYQGHARKYLQNDKLKTIHRSSINKRIT